MKIEPLTIEQLKQAAKDFLKTYNYTGKEVGKGKAIIFSRPTGMGFADELLVYFHDKNEELIGETLKQLSNEFVRIPGGSGEIGRKFFLSNQTVGLVPPAVTEHGFKYQVPVQFFDREFSPQAMTPLKVFEKRSFESIHSRIPQPYYKAKNISDSEDVYVPKSDLLDELVNDIKNAKQPSIRIVIAPAGYGKTVLMSSLYIKLLEDFKKDKQSLKSGIRPLMMLPGHIKRAEDINALINNFVGDEYDYGYVSNETFKFWVNQGLVVWLLDGLEELILRIPDPEDLVLQLLEDFIYDPQTKNAQIVISIRKPLLSITPGLKEVINEWQGLGISTYELSDWGHEQFQTYINANLPLPEKEKSAFFEQIISTPVLSELCRVPYYFDLIAELRKNDEVKIFKDDIELVQYSVEKICDREFGKGLDKDIFPVEKQIDFFSTIAVEGLKQKNNLLPIGDFIEWAKLDLSEFQETISDEQLACLKRHSVLLPFDNYIDFLQDIIKDYFLARGSAEEIKKGNITSLDNEDLEIGNFPFKYLLKESVHFKWDEIFQRLWQIDASTYKPSIAFRNALKIYLLSSELEKETKINGLLNNKNLNGLIFQNLNLANADFESSKLNSTQFINCNLENACFDRCHFKETTFSKGCNLHGATTRDSILESIFDDKKIINFQKEIRQYFLAKTQLHIEENMNVPCQATIDLKKVLEKFTRRRKGYGIRSNFVAWDRAAQNAVDFCLKHRFLIAADSPRYLQIKNSYYDSLSKFSQKLELTPEILKCLNELCPDTSTGCKHIQEVR